MNFSTISKYWRFSLNLAQNEHFHFDSIGNRYLFQAIKKTFIRRRDHLNVFICNIAKLYNSETFFQPSTVYKNRNKLLTYCTFLCSMNMKWNVNLIEYYNESFSPFIIFATKSHENKLAKSAYYTFFTTRLEQFFLFFIIFVSFW